MKGQKSFFKLALMVAVLCVFAFSINNVSALQGQGLELSLVNQEPDPVEPGKYVDIRLKVESIGDRSIENVELEFIPEYPFTIEDTTQRSTNIGSLSPFQKDDAGKIVKYKVRVSDTAVEGTNTIRFRYKYEGQNWDTAAFDVFVRTTDALVTITDVRSEPTVFSPGEEGKVKITVKNTADSVMKDVNLKLDLALSSIESGTTYMEALPFAPINTVTEKRVSSLSSNEEIIFTYDVKSYPSATPGVYKVPILLTYEDDLNNEFEKRDIIGLVVGAEPNTLVTIDSKEFNANTGTITFKVVNRGIDTVKFTTLVLKESDSFEILSSPESYIGNIDSDDYESIDYDLEFKDGTTEADFSLILTYSDSNNVNYKEDIALNTAVELQAETRSPINPVSMVIVILLIGVVVLGFLHFRKKSKK